MTEREAFEAAYRQAFPDTSGMQPDLFWFDEHGEYTHAKVFVAFRLWQAARATQSDRAVGMAMTNEQGEKYGALLDSSIPDRTPLYALRHAEVTRTT